MSILAQIAAAAAVPAILFAPQASLPTAHVRLGDIADVSALPADLQSRAAALELAVLPRDTRRTVIDRAWLASRARALVPGLAPYLGAQTGSVVILRHALAAPVPVVRGADAGSIHRGETVEVFVRAGPVAVTRAATALQDAVPGGMLFVVTQERSVLAAQCCGDR